MKEEKKKEKRKKDHSPGTIEDKKRQAIRCVADAPFNIGRPHHAPEEVFRDCEERHHGKWTLPLSGSNGKPSHVK